MNADWSSPCLDCGIDTLPVDECRAETYMVTDDVWRDAGMPSAPCADDDDWDAENYLCIGCLETRLGRQLHSADFTDCPMNDLSLADTERYAWTWRTPRLIDRLSRDAPNPAQMELEL